jgi:hypothetical protein
MTYGSQNIVLCNISKIKKKTRGSEVNLYRGLSIHASYHVSVYLAKRFQRRRFKCEKLTKDGCQVMGKAHMPFGQVSEQMLNIILFLWLSSEF